MEVRIAPDEGVVRDEARGVLSSDKGVRTGLRHAYVRVSVSSLRPSVYSGLAYHTDVSVLEIHGLIQHTNQLHPSHLIGLFPGTSLTSVYGPDQRIYVFKRVEIVLCSWRAERRVPRARPCGYVAREVEENEGVSEQREHY